MLEAIHETSHGMFSSAVSTIRCARMHIGQTECLNVGDFRARGTPYVLQV